VPLGSSTVSSRPHSQGARRRRQALGRVACQATSCSPWAPRVCGISWSCAASCCPCHCRRVFCQLYWLRAASLQCHLGHCPCCRGYVCTPCLFSSAQPDGELPVKPQRRHCPFTACASLQRSPSARLSSRRRSCSPCLFSSAQPDGELPVKPQRRHCPFCHKGATALTLSFLLWFSRFVTVSRVCGVSWCCAASCCPCHCRRVLCQLDWRAVALGHG